MNCLSVRLVGFAQLLIGASLGAAPLTWFPDTPLASARSSAATVVTANGSILMIGGSPVGSISPLTYGGANLQPLDTTHIAPGALVLSSGLIAVYGGKESGGFGSVMNSVISYDPLPASADGEGDEVPLASMSTARYDLAYARDAAGRGYAIGGLGNNSTVLASVERYDPAADAWTLLAALPEGRYHFGAVFDGTNTIYTFGGRTNVSAGTETVTVLSYDVSANSWGAVASMPVATAGSTAIMGSDGKVYVIGGTAGGVVTNLVQVYDPGSNSWVLATPLPAAVSAAGGAVDGFGRLVVFGGIDSSNVNLTASWVSQRLNIPDAAPVFTTSPPTKATYQILYTYTAAASGNPQPTFQLISGPGGMQIDNYSGQLTWTPQADQLGTNVVTIRATNFAGSVDRTVAINTIGPTPDAPANLVMSNLTENSVTLSWDPVIPVLGSVTYRVYYRHVIVQPHGSPRVVFILLQDNLSSPSATIGGLAAGSSHTYAVTAVAAGAESARSQTITITTLKPQPPTNLHVTGLTSTSITLAWDPSPGPVPIASYEVWGWINNGVTSAIYGSGITNTTLTINGLVPGSTHEWGVRGYDAAGNVSAFDYGPIVVNPAPTPAVLTDGSPTANGGFQFTVQASAVQTTLIQATTNPADSASWTTIGTILPASSTFTFTDPDASQFDLRFYRVISP